MESIISIDAFDAFRTENGIQINEKKAGARKVSIVITVVGIIFFGIGWIPMEGLTYKWITTMFTMVFFWGGILLTVLGILVLILKGSGSGEGPVTTVNKDTQILTLRGKEIPFTDVGEISIQTTDMMGRKMNSILYRHKGRRKGFVGGAILTDDVESLENLVRELNELMGNA